MLVWMTLAPALAQDVVGGEIPDINAQTFRPTIDGAGMLWVDDAGRRRSQVAVGRALLQYVDDPLIYVSGQDETTRLVTSLLQLNLLGGVNVGPARIGLDLPVYLRTGSEVLGREAGLGDIAGDVKVTLLDKPDSPIDLAVNGRVWAPTASVENALGNRQFAWELAGVISREFGPLLVAANIGTRGGPRVALENIELNDAFIGRLGLGVATSDLSGVALEAQTILPYTAPLGDPAGSPLELLGSGFIYPSRRSNLVLRAGAGGGVSPGIGSPDFRLLFGLGFEPRSDEGDRDGDGYLDSEDQCPDEPEDFDKFEDHDGCPDPDNDQDGILDVDDDCPNVPEDFDGYMDEDGCPEGTLVSLTVVDEETEEPLEVARIVVTPEDGPSKNYLTPFEEELEPGVYTIVVNTVGYDPVEMEVVVEEGGPIEVIAKLTRDEDTPVAGIDRGQIDLRDTVHFETNSSVIRPDSYGLLDETVAILREYSEIERIRIEGHTDERGTDDYNQRLSEDRADSVMTYFIAAGINADRLNSVGYGESRPLDTRSIPEAWDKNRRVDFFIEQWAGGAPPE